jgi:hypothetical protein
MLEEDTSVHSVAAGGVASSTVSVANNRAPSGTGAGLGQQQQGEIVGCLVGCLKTLQ